ncbi:MAG TPA: PAS domain S-box protein [Bacteroidales bacterium]|nr:PAS domain S-box protein [Bacteroidales bacterium]
MSENRSKQEIGFPEEDNIGRRMPFDLDSNYLFRVTIDNIPDPVSIKDTESRIILVNKAFRKVFEVSDAGIQGKIHGQDFGDKSSGEVMRKNELEVIETCETIITEETVVTPAGRKTYSCTRSPMINDEGKLTCIFCLSQDITDRKMTQDALERSEREYKELIKYAPAGIYEIDFTKKRFTSVNDSMVHLTGYTKDELLSMNVLDILDEESRKLFIDRVNKITIGEKIPESVTYRIVRKDGNIIHVLLNIRFRLNDKGFPESATVVGHDISDRVVIEQEREQLLTELKKTETKLNLALEAGNIGIWQWNIKTGIFTIDNKLEKMFGLEKNTFSGSYSSFELLFNEEDIEHIRKSVNQAIEKNSLFETVCRTKPVNGEIRYVSLNGCIEKNEEDEVIGIIGVCIDFTGLKKNTELVITSLNEELLRSNRELQNFAYVASHDLQEPLRTVTSFTQLLAMNYRDKLDDKAIEYIDFAVSGAKRMYNLLNDLLHYSRMQSKTPEFKKVDMDQVVRQVIRNLSLLIEETKAEITFDDLPVVPADYSQMTILIQNLVSNSLKFCTGTPRININAKRLKTSVIFTVKDEGIGIEHQYFEKIFQIFQRLNPGRFQGTGMGLALCKRIVESHGGKIWVESEAGKGSSFIFSIPRRQKRPFSR